MVGLILVYKLIANIIAQSITAIILRTEDTVNSTTTTTIGLEENVTSAKTLLDLIRASEDDTYDYANSCGRNNCPSTKLPGTLTNITRPSFIILYISLIVIVLLSMVITGLFMDDIKEESENDPNEMTTDAASKQAEARIQQKITLSVVGKKFLYCSS